MDDQEAGGDVEAPKKRPISLMRRIIADRMLTSVRTKPQVTLISDVDMREATGFVAAIKESVGVTITDLIVASVAQALPMHPLLNSTEEDGFIVTSEAINIGVAVAVRDGLQVPVVKDADKKTLREISVVIRDFVVKAKERKLKSEDITGGTFTVTNLGMYGVDSFTPIVNPPESAILGVGKLSDRLVLSKGSLESRPYINLCLTFDHRILDGAIGARFLGDLKAILLDPRRRLPWKD